MKFYKYLLVFLVFVGSIYSCDSSKKLEYDEHFRPQYHFSPAKNWINDPNGMVFYKGEYHLFYQYNPEDKVWGPMHWGHAISKDLLHWEQQPIAIYPDSIGEIFSGSAVVDKHNTAGFQKGEEKTLIAIFTYHNPDTGIETQGIAYSNDEGRTWDKYKGNPVIDNPGLDDFRDPKVSWYEPEEKWIMTIASGDHIDFYSSDNLKDWQKESSFGKNLGAHGGVWETPDLISMDYNGTEKWVLLVSINPGGPAGGSATQYFIGQFDGHRFIPDDSTKIKWLDYGADNYAGVTWSNTGNKHFMVGWMNNWEYADTVPTDPWRGQMTLPRELSLANVNGDISVKSSPIKAIDKVKNEIFSKEDFPIDENGFNKELLKDKMASSEIKVKVDLNRSNEFTLSLKNSEDEYVDIGYDKGAGELFLDRNHAGIDDFSKDFAGKQKIKLSKDLDELHLRVFYDRSSIEIFINGGKWVLTDLIYPNTYYNQIEMNAGDNSINIEELKVFNMESTWNE